MPYAVVSNAEDTLAALIDPDHMRALGPVAVGEGATSALDEFAGSLEFEPSSYTAWDLAGYWEAYQVARVQLLEEAQALADQEQAEQPPEPIRVTAEPDELPEPGQPTATANGAAVEQEAGSDAPPIWANVPSCTNCGNRTFGEEEGELRCTICGTPAPEGATASA